MTNTRSASLGSCRRRIIFGALFALGALAPLSAALAVPPAVQQFQQAAQQQRASDKLEQSQQQQQLRQGVVDNAARPTAANPLLQQQINQASDAQRQRDLATQQSLLDQQRAANQQRLDTPAQTLPEARHGH